MKLAALATLIILLLSTTSHAVADVADIARREVEAQAESLLVFAERLGANGNFYPSVTECKRALFLFPDSVDRSRTYRCMSLGLTELGETKDAIRAARAAVRSATGQHDRDERRLDLAAVLVATGYPGTAIVELVQLSVSSAPNTASEAQLLLCIAHVQQAQWELASRALQLYIENSPVSDGLPGDRRASAVDSLLRRATGTTPKSESLATALSTMVPGLGQLYVGHPLEAIHSAALNASLGYWVYKVAVERTVLESAAGPFPWFLKYYLGSRYWARTRARERNERDRQQTIDQVLGTIRATEVNEAAR